MLIILILPGLYACREDYNINFSDISYFHFSIDASPKEYFDFEFDKNAMLAKTVHSLMGETVQKTDIWTDEKLTGFIKDLQTCNIEKWTGDYKLENVFDGIRWDIAFKNDKNTLLNIEGVQKWPTVTDWNRYIDVLAKYFDSEVAVYKE